MIKADYIINLSENTTKEIQIASGYISVTNILLENENIALEISANGTIVFYPPDDAKPIKAELPDSDGGREVYENVVIRKEDDNIIVSFPVYQWIDNYPNCDGEHDRWDTVTIGYHDVVYDLSNSTVSIKEYK